MADGLEDIALLLGFSDQGRFKAQAYERGAEVVAGLAGELSLVIQSGRLHALEGIGPSLSKQILELWETGSSSLLERLRSENPPGAAELARVPGLTPRRIRLLSTSLGIASLEQLRDACRAQRIRGLPGFGLKTEQKLCEAVEAMQQRALAEPRILLSVAQQLGHTLEHALCVEERVVSVQLAGAARRGEETLAALDLLITLVDDDEATLDLERILARVAALPQVLRVDRAARCAQLACGIPLRLHLTSAALTGTALLRATGPLPHVELLSARAQAQTHASTQRAGTEPGALPLSAFASEHELYRSLGLHWVPPELRSAPDALTQAAVDDFSDLISAGDIRGMVHCHTTHSDGKHSVEEMARAAAALGMQYITITDHSPSAHYAHGVTRERLELQWEEIRQAEQAVGIRILRGTESDILADGALDYPDDVLARFDVIIASIHSRFRMTRAQMTERLVRAMQLPVFKIWGHALGRLLLSREPIDCDVEAVLDALAGGRGAIEINGDPHRLDLPPEWIPAARARGIPFVLSVDAHSTAGMGVLPLAATLARRGGLRRAEVLNALPVDDFLARMRAPI